MVIDPEEDTLAHTLAELKTKSHCTFSRLEGLPSHSLFRESCTIIENIGKYDY